MIKAISNTCWSKQLIIAIIQFWTLDELVFTFWKKKQFLSGWLKTAEMNYTSCWSSILYFFMVLEILSSSSYPMRIQVDLWCTLSADNRSWLMIRYYKSGPQDLSLSWHLFIISKFVSYTTRNRKAQIITCHYLCRIDW